MVSTTRARYATTLSTEKRARETRRTKPLPKTTPDFLTSRHSNRSLTKTFNHSTNILKQVLGRIKEKQQGQVSTLDRGRIAGNMIMIGLGTLGEMSLVPILFLE